MTLCGVYQRGMLNCSGLRHVPDMMPPPFLSHRPRLPYLAPIPGGALGWVSKSLKENSAVAREGTI